MKDEQINVAASVSAAVTKIGSGTAVIFGFTLNELGVVVGIATAVLGLIMQAYFGLKNLQERKKAYQAIVARADKSAGIGDV